VQLSIAALLLILVCLVLLSAFFSGAEIGMMSLNRYRLRYLVKNKNKQAIRVNILLQRPDKLLSVVLIGNTLANIVASTVTTLIGQRLYGAAGVAITTVLLALVVLVVSEMVPKTLAALHPQQVAFLSALPLIVLQKIMSPIVYLVSLVTNSILTLFGISLDHGQREVLSGEELRAVVCEASGLLPKEHKSMLIGLLDLEQASVEDIMIPTSDIVGVDLNKSLHEILNQLETAQHTRLPIYYDNINQLVGMIHVRDVLNLALQENLDKEGLIKIADGPYFVPEATPLNSQIVNFRKEKKRSCFVVNEYGDLQGLVTIEDILEEIIGEFTTDIATLSKSIIRQDDGSFIVDASITLRYLKRLLDWQLPLLGPKTLSGLIIEYLGYIPPADCCLRMEDYQIEILKVCDNMIKTLRMRKLS
jgi:Mg2+/Co2+ transporter CorB